MRKFILILLTVFSLISCSEEKKKFVPNPKYSESVYMKPDSAIGYIKGFIVTTGKDTVYFYCVEYKDYNGVYHRKILKEKDIFGQKR